MKTDKIKLVFATNNRDKLKEVGAMLSQDIELLSLEEIGCREEIEETEDTLEGNALLKARHIKENYGYDCFADDTGLEVNALDGAPGVYSARYAGEDVSYQDNVDKLLSELGGAQDRKARFRTVIALMLDGEKYFFEGICDGEITHQPRGSKGFGYDPVFAPSGEELTFAEMTMDQKAVISHRGLAVKKLAEYLNGI